MLGIIILFGFFLRSWHFSDWLHFELDQARDAKVVGLALDQGIGNLPLLGPKAAGSFLRLGPLFYYTEYLSGLIFGNTPAGIAVISLIFSCATIVLFYFFVRRFFDRKISVMLLVLFSISLFMIMYSRFAWNPNNLPFFVMLLLYALLRMTDSKEKHTGRWLIIASVAFAFASQLHFIALLSLPMIAVTYLLIKRPIISMKYWIGAVLILIFFYIPPVINDYKTGGDNVSEFQKLFLKKSTKSKDEHSLAEKIVKNARESSQGFFIITTGYQKVDLPDVKIEKISKWDVVCDFKCRAYFFPSLIALAMFFVGIALYMKNFFEKKDDFLLLIGIWFFVTMGIFVPIAYDLAPRFFLLIAPAAFIFVGFLLDFLQKKKLAILAYIIFILMAGSNLFFVHERFSQMKKAPVENFEIDSDKILKERDRVTLEQQLKITDHIEDIYGQNGFPVYINSEAFYRRSFIYHLEQRNIPRDDFRNSGKNVYREGNYFLIYPDKESLDKKIQPYLKVYEISENKSFGTLRVIRLVPQEGTINAERQIFGPEKKPTSASGVPVRCRWNEILGECNTDGTEEDDEG